MDFGKLGFWMFLGLAKGGKNRFWAVRDREGRRRAEKEGEERRRGEISLSRLEHSAQVKAVLAETTFLYLTKPDTGRCRQILAPTGFSRGPDIDHFLKKPR